MLVFFSSWCPSFHSVRCFAPFLLYFFFLRTFSLVCLASFLSFRFFFVRCCCSCCCRCCFFFDLLSERYWIEERIYTWVECNAAMLINIYLNPLKRVYCAFRPIIVWMIWASDRESKKEREREKERDGDVHFFWLIFWTHFNAQHTFNSSNRTKQENGR